MPARAVMTAGRDLVILQMRVDGASIRNIALGIGCSVGTRTAEQHDDSSSALLVCRASVSGHILGTNEAQNS